MRYKAKTSSLDISVEADWPDGPPWDAEGVNERRVKYDFEKDALWMNLDHFMEKYHITKIYRLGREYCGKVYYDAVTKQWLEGDKLIAFLQQTSSMEPG